MQKAPVCLPELFCLLISLQYANASHQDYECKDKSQRGQYLKYASLNLVI
ncbi:MAG: hypothetical protein JWP67_1396 [Mucilaginibacter sp.]|nr:hypothetical protein [Mucilaginibacter sp.]